MTFDPDAPSTHDGIYGLPHGPDQARVILIPVPWDATTSYRAGTLNGPQAILKASRQVDLHDVETGDPYTAGIHMLLENEDVRTRAHAARGIALPIIERGGVGGDVGEGGEGDDAGESAGLRRAVDMVNEMGAELNRWVHDETARWLAAGKIVGVVGGDHSVPYGAIQAVAERHPGVGVLHFDAHADLRDAYEGFTWSHASIMHNVATRIPGVSRLVQVGIRDVGTGEAAFIAASAGRIVTHFEPELAAERFEGVSFADQCKRILDPLPAEVYLSWDIDGLDPVYCPNTGTPVPGGWSFSQACYLLRAVVKSGRKIVGFDLNEVAPGPDETDEWDGNVGARLLYKMIGWALKSSPSAG